MGNYLINRNSLEIPSSYGNTNKKSLYAKDLFSDREPTHTLVMLSVRFKTEKPNLEKTEPPFFKPKNFLFSTKKKKFWVKTATGLCKFVFIVNIIFC